MGHAPAARRFDRDLTERLESLRSALPTLKPWFACASDREMDEAFGSPAEHMEGAELLYQRPFTSLGTPWEACLIHSYSFFPLGGVGATLAAIEAGAGMVLTASWDGWMDAL